MTAFDVYASVIRWSAEAGREAAELAVSLGQDLDVDGGMGLWQSFQLVFPKDSYRGSEVNYDLMVMMHTQTFSASVKEVYRALTSPR